MWYLSIQICEREHNKIPQSRMVLRGMWFKFWVWRWVQRSCIKLRPLVGQKSETKLDSKDSPWSLWKSTVKANDDKHETKGDETSAEGDQTVDDTLFEEPCYQEDQMKRSKIVLK